MSNTTSADQVFFSIPSRYAVVLNLAAALGHAVTYSQEPAYMKSISATDMFTAHQQAIVSIAAFAAAGPE
jgi:hypothetical protein